MARETSTSRRVKPRRSSIILHRPLEDLHRAVERAEAEGPLGGDPPTPVVPEEYARRRDPAAGQIPDLRGKIERAILPLDADSGYRQAGAEIPRAPLLGRAVRMDELVRPVGRMKYEPGFPLLEEGKVVRRLGVRGERAEYRVPARLADARKPRERDPQHQAEHEQDDGELDERESVKASTGRPRN